MSSNFDFLQGNEDSMGYFRAADFLEIVDLGLISTVLFTTLLIFLLGTLTNCPLNL
ncbi:hypothetical protein HCZ80_03535 [Limosilactobacillus fermentum]|uniref:hypothetical protein n=1 Tax=Limosilactobacillus fermentum TaxID=1613 RepID=UPI00249B1585|nr:hypothetical protein [Limosilactobacillus fermentum]WGW22172.1 hypothetical protein P8770_03930 [Limosilactobacillus fermentum]